MKCAALNYLCCNVSIVVMYRVSFFPYTFGVKFPMNYGSFFLSTTLPRLSLKNICNSLPCVVWLTMYAEIGIMYCF